MTSRASPIGWLPCAVLGLVAAGCARSTGPGAADAGLVGSGGSAAGAQADGSAGAGSLDAGAMGLGPAPNCDLLLGSCPPTTDLGIWRVLLDAAAFGEGATLTGLGGEAVLVSGGDAPWRVVRVHNDREAESSGRAYSVWAFPDPDLVGIDVAQGVLSDESFPNRSVFVLACSQDRARCTLLRAEPGEAALTPWQGSEMPSGFEPRGLVFDEAATPPALCAYGNGLLCFQTAAWQEAIAPAPDLQLNAVDIGSLWSLAVGSHGRYWKRERALSGSLLGWVEQAPLADIELTSASVAGAGGVIVGEGSVQAALGKQRQSFGCGTPDNLAAFMLHPYSPASFATAITLAGQVLWHLSNAPAGEFCVYQELAIDEILDTGAAPCGISRNLRALGERVLIGTNFCAIE